MPAHADPVEGLHFNQLLESAGVDPKQVRLVRHQDNRHDRKPYDLWLAADGSLDRYQAIQATDRFREARYIASFVATPFGETLFVGLYRLTGKSKAPVGTIDPLSGQDEVGKVLYDIALAPELASYRGRVVVEWGEGKRSWVQLAHRHRKLIKELHKAADHEPFPGFVEFRKRLSELAGVPHSWREVLSSVRGVYLLCCPVTGTQYVGSAGGERGFWARWEAYVASGHGGNKRMIDLPASDYQVTILEVAASSWSAADLIAMESRWKDKLQTRTHGLNAN